MQLDYFKEKIIDSIRYQFAHADSDFWKKWNRNKGALAEVGISLTHELDDLGKKIWIVVRATNIKDNFPRPVKVSPYIIRDKSKLLFYQVEPVGALVGSLLSHKFCLDASDTGTGKTYTSLKTAILSGYQPAIVCTKTGIKDWRKACAFYGINPVFICNWESCIGRLFKTDNIITKVTQPPNKYIEMSYHPYTGRPVFKWLIPPTAKVVIIFDEIHKANGNDSSYQRLVRTAQVTGYHIMGLSATACDKVEKFRMIGSLIGMFKYENFRNWLEENGCFVNNFNAWGTVDEKEILKKINKYIFPNYGARVRKDAVPGFPECQNIAKLYYIDKSDLQNKKYEAMKKQIEKIKAKKTAKGEFEILALRMKHRQIAETYKIPLLIDLAKEYVEAGHSVIIFTSFVATLETIVKKLKTECYISGTQSGKKGDIHRAKAIADFGADKKRICVANIQAGGTAIDGLQDLLGNYSRVGLIPPNDDAILTKQTLGRIHRANSKSKSMNILVYSARTVEEEIFVNVHNKLKNIDLLNDGDLADKQTFTVA